MPAFDASICREAGERESRDRSGSDSQDIVAGKQLLRSFESSGF